MNRSINYGKKKENSLGTNGDLLLKKILHIVLILV